MTTKDLLEITGCSRSTLIRLTAKMFPGLTQKGKATCFTEVQGIALIKALPKSNVVQMAQVHGSNGTGCDARLDRIEAAVERLCVSIASLIPQAAPPAQALLEAPKMTDRATLNRIVRAYADQCEIGHGEVWGLLYTEAEYRLGVNLRLRAKHRQLMALDVAEELGLIPQLVAIAREVLK